MRIRTVKPEFWTDDAVTDCSLSARLLLIGTLNAADDEGNLERSAKQLKAKIFPNDAIDCEPLIKELIYHGLLIEYSVSGQNYLHIKGFSKHQVINRKSKPRCPFYEESQTTHGVISEDSTPKGREGKGSYMSDKSDDAAKVIDHLNEKTGSAYRKVDSTLRMITGRLKEGATVDECIAVIDDRVNAWGSDTKMAEYLRPKTLFSPTNFANYIGNIGNAPAMKVDL